jgi:enamine deaminase RidA (YjgF/YER057c/UK114 family)
MLIANPKGNYRFIAGRNPFSSGAVADEGYEIVHAAFDPMLPLDAGFARIETHLRSCGRPLNALSGMELRIPQALSLEGFRHFNQGYVQRFAKWGVQVGDLNPVARTNVAVEINPAPVPCVFGFSYTVASSAASQSTSSSASSQSSPASPASQRRATFVLSGAPEVRGSGAGERTVVAPGDVSRDGMRKKIVEVLSSLGALLQEVGASWGDATAMDVYTVQDIHPHLADLLLREVPSANVRGITWHYARPPVADADFEMGVRRVLQEIILPV